MFSECNFSAYQPKIHTTKPKCRALDFEQELQMSCKGNIYTAHNQFQTTQTENGKSDLEQEMNEMMKLAPFVLQRLQEENIGNVFLDCFQQIHAGTHPVDNIAFLLWAEVVKWFSTDITSKMRYSKKTKKFWKAGWRLFGGKFLRYMAGFKNETQIVKGEAARGACKPSMSDINFAVPTENILREYNPYGEDIPDLGTRKPGIYTDIMHKISPNLQSISCCLTFDGKRIKQGLTETGGDIDLIGFENGPSLSERQAQLINAINVHEDAKTVILLSKAEEIYQLSAEEKSQTIINMTRSYSNLSDEIKQARDLKQSKTYAREKFIERGGQDWQKGKYIYVVSAIDALLHDIDIFVTTALNVLEQIRLGIIALKNSGQYYCVADCLNLNSCENYKPLQASLENTDTRYIKQGSLEWHSVRNQAKITGSTAFKALGLDGLKKLREHFERVMCDVPEPEPSDISKQNMLYGSLNEVNAVATVVGRILPVVSPELDLYEEGCICMSDEGNPFLVVSPDGSLQTRMNVEGNREIKMAVEIKCPVKSVHCSFPERYYLQCVMEMEVLNVQQLLFVSWTPEITTAYVVERDAEIFKTSMSLAQTLYGKNAKRPSKLPSVTKELRCQIKEKVKLVHFIGEFPSLKANVSEESCVPRCRPNTPLLNDFESLENLTEIFSRLVQISKEAYELRRQKAVEALVFLCCDLDRVWNQNQLLWSPVCWCAKGYSLSTDVTRNIMESVLDECNKAGLHVPACSFDGQWHNIVVRDILGNPLTLLQLQKDVWNSVQKMSKSDILKELRQCKNVPAWQLIFEGDGSKKYIQCSNGGIPIPTLTGRKQTKNMKADKSICDYIDTLQQVPALSDALCDSVLDENSNICSVLAMQQDKDIIEELSTCNISDEGWSRSLDVIQSAEKTEEDAYSSDDQILHPLFLEPTENNSEDQSENRIDEVDTSNSTCEMPNSKYNMTYDDCQKMLLMLQTDKNANKKGVWDKVNVDELYQQISHVSSLEKLRDVDIRVVLRYLKTLGKMNKTAKETLKKSVKIELILENVHISQLSRTNEQRHVRAVKKASKNPSSLQSLAFGVLKKVSKQSLNLTYAEYIWEEEKKKWINQSPIKNNIKVEGLDQPEFWTYQPEFSLTRQQLEVRCIDSTHLFTRTRRKTCKGGIEGLDNMPWLKVAKQGKTLLTPIMVEEVTDCMSMPMALTHFGYDVQNAMTENGDHRAANLCKSVLEWWRAEDEPGISAHDRISMRLSLRERLLRGYNFGRFPPPGMYVNGWPVQLWEALLANIDAKSILYSLTKNGTYNTRAFSSMMGETFFAELTNQDRGCHGTVSAEDFGRYIGRTVEQMQTRLDPERYFFIQMCLFIDKT